jgi:actin-like ATPase involved in cell morphogenesis
VGYALGIDLGTTYTAAATFRDGHAEIASLGTHTAAVPSVVLVRADQEVLTGEAAARRASTEPDRVAREFKRRLGDTTPIFLGGAPFSAEALTARLLRSVVGEVAAREGGPPDACAVTYPANWGPFKQELLDGAIRDADLEGALTLTEPEAAAIHYASTERVEQGETVAVYDLGGGTFDSAVLRKTAGGWETLGRPEGIEHLGGIDFDAAVFAHVQRSLHGALESLDENDEAAMAAVGRLRQECAAAKEALSADTDATINVMLPGIQTDVRLTRGEFEDMIRPAIEDSIAALQRSIQSAGITPVDLKAVLLVGGSSRIPLVAQMVGATLGRPVAVDVHPKHAIALGAALAAAATDEDTVGGGVPVAGVAGAAVAGAAAAGVVGVAGAAGAGASSGGGAEPPTQGDPTPPMPTEPLEPASGPPSGPVGAGGGAGGPGGTPPPRSGDDDYGGGSTRRVAIVIGIVIVVLLIAGVAIALAASGGDDDDTPTTTTRPTTTTVRPTTTLAPTTAPTQPTSPPTQPTSPPTQPTSPPTTASTTSTTTTSTTTTTTTTPP